MTISVDDVHLINLGAVVEPNGNLVAIESDQGILPFDIRRVFYVFGVGDGHPRGCHAHYETEQLLICMSGEIEVTCKDGVNESKFLLDSPQMGLYIPSMIWDEQIYKCPESILLSICSTHYDRRDYIHDYEEFQSLVKEGS
tara:strand:- start:499 stop:921 length:423 start_codon:yes stop_codon:yes gene_type:complete